MSKSLGEWRYHGEFTIMIPPDEYARKNPTWGEAMKGPDAEKWKAADRAERDQHFLEQKMF